MTNIFQIMKRKKVRNHQPQRKEIMYSFLNNGGKQKQVFNMANSTTNMRRFIR